jgi:1-acyl-sn-glycerol-3-phosphate acyltransferase
MILANKKAFLDSLLYLYLQVSLRGHFTSIEAAGLEHLTNLKSPQPVIAVANHTCWWDGLIVFYLTRFCSDREYYCMMEEKQLRHYKFFTWIGAFSVDLENGLRAALSIRYAAKLLRKPNAFLWIFPQGEQVSRYDKILVKHGVDYLARQTNDAVILPVAFAYEFFREQKPQVLIRFGKPIPAIEVTTPSLQAVLQDLADTALLDCRNGNLEAYQVLLKPRLSMNKRWEWFLFLLRGKASEFNARN